MYIEDVNPKERAKLAETIMNLLKEGHALFLIQGEETRRIKGYDQESNEWLVLAEPHESKIAKRGKARIPIDRSSRVTAVAPIAGG
jgi:hypothetical protein